MASPTPPAAVAVAALLLAGCGSGAGDSPGFALYDAAAPEDATAPIESGRGGDGAGPVSVDAAAPGVDAAGSPLDGGALDSAILADAGGDADDAADGGTTVASDAAPPITFGASCDGGATTLTGTVFAPNGTDPIPNVRVYAAGAINPYPPNYCDKCSAPIDPAYASTKSAPDGTFTLDLGAVPLGSIDFAIQIGRFRRHTSLAVTPCQTSPAPVAAATLPGSASAGDIPKIAVSSGNKDHLDAILAALGITEYDCYEGRKAAGASTSTCNQTATANQTIADVLADPVKLGAYHMAFLSCAPGAYAAFVGTHSQTTMTQNTASWVASGGRLFATDTAYDYLAQPFPGSIVWAGKPGAPPPVDGANLGCSPPNNTTGPSTSYSVTVDDPTLAAWLKVVGVSGSPTVGVSGFYSPWSLIGSLPATTTEIANGTMPVDLSGGTTVCAASTMQNVPLTAKFDVPSCGRVIYSSYHTLTNVSPGSLSAQEKIMEYLIFDAAFCSF